MRRFLGRAIIILCFFSTATSCVRRPSPSASDDDSVVAQATATMEAGRFEEAAKGLTAFLQIYPNDTRVRLLLSNVYVRWSGVKFSDFIPLARFYLNRSENKNVTQDDSGSLLKALRRPSGGSKSETLNAVYRFEKILASLDAFSSVFNLIPEVEPSRHGHFNEGLNQAILAGSTKKGDLLYRVVLRAVEMKYKLTQQDQLNFMNNQCQLVPGALKPFIADTRFDYLAFITDLTQVYPNLTDPLFKNLTQFDELTSQIENKLESVFGKDAPESTASPEGVGGRTLWDCL